MAVDGALGVDGLRADGRRWHECRGMDVKLDCVKGADGSAEWVQGLTRVVVSVYGPREPSAAAGGAGGGGGGGGGERMAVRCEVHQAPSSSSMPVSTAGTGGGRADRRLHELAIRLKDALESIIITREYPKSAVSIVVTVPAVDGPLSLHSIVFNTAILALVTASVPLHTMAASCNAALLHSSILGENGGGGSGGEGQQLAPSNDIIVDTTFGEESSSAAMAVMTVVAGMHLRSGGKGTAADMKTNASLYSVHCDGRVPNVDAYDDVLSVVVDGCRCLIVFMSDKIAAWTAEKAISCDVIQSEYR